jgi:transcription initiation factor IIE alpha subunit
VVKLSVSHRPDALLQRMAADAPVIAYVLEAGPLTEEELAARSRFSLADVRRALDLLVAEGVVRESGEHVALRARRRGR